MRLTLRTMLAYMDNTLESEDTQAIGEKIDQNERASRLLHRTRDCMRRLRLGAPKMMDQDKGLDPNTVAEYLDNTLKPDRVVDFERVCLESDVHLAEAASCHQILAMVLGEPAEVTPESRSRMYALPDQVPPATSTPATLTPPKLPPNIPNSKLDANPEPPQSQHELPPLPPRLRPNTRETRPGKWQSRLIMVAVILLLGLGAGLLMFSEKGSAMLASLGWGHEEPVNEVSTAEDPGPVVSAEESLPEGPMEVVEIADATKVTTPVVSETPISEPDMPAPDEVPELPETPDLPISSPPPSEPVQEEVASIPAVSPAPSPEPFRMPPATVDPNAKDAPLPREPVGQLVSSNEILLKLNPEDGSWQRVDDQSPLLCKDTFVAMPTYRPLVAHEEVQSMFVGPTRFRLPPTDSAGVPGVIVENGRVILRATGAPEATLRLRIGDHAGMFTFADAESVVAIELSRRGSLGRNPRTDPAPLAADFYAISGTISWKADASETAVSITAPGRLSLDREPLEVVAEEVVEFPPWAVASTVSPLDQRASDAVQSLLSEKRPIVLILRELADHRQQEIRRLAFRCLAAIDEFELLVKALDDLNHKMDWPDYLTADLLREATVRDPNVAVKVHDMIEKLHGKEGNDLFEMLWRYHTAEVSREEAQRLVGYLSHKDLIFRRLSFWNLRRITGMGLYYRPEEIVRERRVSIEKWKDRIKTFGSPKAAPVAEEAPSAVEKAANSGD